MANIPSPNEFQKFLEKESHGDQRAQRKWLGSQYLLLKENIKTVSDDVRKGYADLFDKYGRDDFAAKIAPQAPPANDEIFKNGEPILGFYAESYNAEKWVKAVAKRANANIDWHYSGGIAQLLHLGDEESRKRVVAAIDELKGELKGKILKHYEPNEKGLYRKGVTQVPEGSIMSAHGVYVQKLPKEEERPTKDGESWQQKADKQPLNPLLDSILAKLLDHQVESDETPPVDSDPSMGESLLLLHLQSRITRMPESVFKEGEEKIMKIIAYAKRANDFHIQKAGENLALTIDERKKEWAITHGTSEM